MNNNYTSIILNGFRASGKSTIGKVLAEKLRWNFVEMDYLISLSAGQSINSLTNNGTTWTTFRQMEQDLLKELSEEKNIVISTGGGVGVNNIKNKKTNTTYGEENARVMRQAKNTLLIVLVAGEQVIAERIRTEEMQKDESTRPILDEKKAEEVTEKIKRLHNDPKKQKKLLVDAIIETEMKLYHARKKLYEELSSHTFDTGKESIDQVVNKITKLIKQ